MTHDIEIHLISKFVGMIKICFMHFIIYLRKKKKVERGC